MTPLDKAREALAAVEKALPDNVAAISTSQVGGSAICGATTEVNGKIAVDCVAEVYGLERAAAIVSAVNFVRADLPALMAEHERLADRVAKLEAGAIEAATAAHAFVEVMEHSGDGRHYGGCITHEQGQRLMASHNALSALLTPAEGAEDGR